MGSRSSPSPSPLTVDISIRDVSFSVSCGLGVQSCKWLCSVACYRYAQYHPEYDVEQFIPIHCTDALSQPIFPHEIINERLSSGDTIHIELLGPTVGLDDPAYEREKTLWELYAYTPQNNYVPVVFLFDATGLALTKPPGVFGNFNGWGIPIPMTFWKGNLYRHQMDFPAGADIVFQFAVGTGHQLSPHYRVVRDSYGTKLNHLQVRPASHNYKAPVIEPPSVTEYMIDGGRGIPGLHPDDMDSNSSSHRGSMLRVQSSSQRTIVGKNGKIRGLDDDASEEQELEALENKILSPRIVGVFSGVHELTAEMKERVFNQDWSKIQLADLIRALEKRMTIKEMLRRYYDDLRRMFRFYSSYGGKDIMHMNLLKFIHFCKTCKIVDQRVTVAKLDEIFRRVNIEEEYDEARLASNPENYRAAMVLKADPFNPDNQFIRAEFMESLVRIAIIKYKHLDPAQATEKLIKEHILPYAEISRNDIRQQLLDENVQKVFALYSRRLYKTFTHYASEDQMDQHHTASTTINCKEFQMIIDDYQLVDSSLSHRKALQCFALSQEEEVGESVESSYEMVYAEFLEALARIAVERYAALGALASSSLPPPPTPQAAPTELLSPASTLQSPTSRAIEQKIVTDPIIDIHPDVDLSVKVQALFQYMFPQDVDEQNRILRLQITGNPQGAINPKEEEALQARQAAEEKKKRQARIAAAKAAKEEAAREAALANLPASKRLTQRLPRSPQPQPSKSPVRKKPATASGTGTSTPNTKSPVTSRPVTVLPEGAGARPAKKVGPTVITPSKTPTPAAAAAPVSARSGSAATPNKTSTPARTASSGTGTARTPSKSSASASPASSRPISSQQQKR